MIKTQQNKAIPLEYVPNNDEEYMNPQMLQYFENKLVVWKNDLMKQTDHVKEFLAEYSAREPDHVDEGTAEEVRETDYLLVDRDINLISEIDAALKRIESGEYGYCEETGEEIGVGRLMAWPIARLSIEAQEAKEHIKK